MREKFEFDESHVAAVAYQYRQFAQRMEIPGMLRVVVDDPDDDQFVECGLAAGARWLVSGDHHLLDLREHQGIRILDAAHFLVEIASRDAPAAGQADSQ